MLDSIVLVQEMLHWAKTSYQYIVLLKLDSPELMIKHPSIF